MLKMLRLDGEVWEIAEGHNKDEDSVNCRRAKPGHDDKAIAAGITHIQTQYGGDPFHEVKRLDGQDRPKPPVNQQALEELRALAKKS